MGCCGCCLEPEEESGEYEKIERNDSKIKTFFVWALVVLLIASFLVWMS